MYSQSRRYANKVVCPHHPDAALIEDFHAGDLVCPKCGLVVGDRVIDVGTEWRTFSNSDTDSKDQSRVGAAENPLYEGGDLSTMIAVPSGPSAALATSKGPAYRNRSTMSTSHRALSKAFREISTMSDRLNLPRVAVDRADGLFKQVYERNLIKGRSHELIATACLFLACKLENVHRTFKEICAVSNQKKKEIGRVFSQLMKSMGTSVEQVTGEELIPRFCSRVELPFEIEKAAVHVVGVVKEKNLVAGRAPASVAAAAIYMVSQASEHRKSAQEIGDVAGVAETTIRQAYKLMLPEAKSLFPEDFKFAIPVQNLPTC